MNVIENSTPWEIHKESIGIKDDKHKYIRVRGTSLGGKFHIADVRFFVCDDEDINKRNELEAYEIAKLIVAAPDLLEALEEALPGIEELNGEFQEGWDSTIKKIEAAISKAKGL